MVSYGAIYATVFNSARNRGFFWGFHFDKQVENAFLVSEAANYGFFFYANDKCFHGLTIGTKDRFRQALRHSGGR